MALAANAAVAAPAVAAGDELLSSFFLLFPLLFTGALVRARRRGCAAQSSGIEIDAPTSGGVGDTFGRSEECFTNSEVLCGHFVHFSRDVYCLDLLQPGQRLRWN